MMRTMKLTRFNSTSFSWLLPILASIVVATLLAQIASGFYLRSRFEDVDDDRPVVWDDWKPGSKANHGPSCEEKTRLLQQEIDKLLGDLKQVREENKSLRNRKSCGNSDDDFWWLMPELNLPFGDRR